MERAPKKGLGGERTTVTRTAYVKGGDVVRHFERMEAMGGVVITSGPDLFPYEFLKVNNADRILLLSRQQRNERYRGRNVEAVVFNGGGRLGVKAARRALIVVKVFWELLRFRPHRVLCGRAGGMLWASFMVARIYAVPWIFSSHSRVSSGFDSWHKRLSRVIDHWCIRRADAVLCHGPFLKQQLQKIGVPVDRIIEFDVCFEDMIGDSSEDGARDGARRVLFVGRVEKEKGVFDLLDAFIRIGRDVRRIELVYAGTGSQLHRLRELVREKGVEGRADVLGDVRHDELAEIIRGSTILVTPTRSEFPEGRCMAAMEGMVMGVPVIGPDIGPFPFLIKHGCNGLLYLADSVDDLTEKLGMALNDNELYERMRRGARESGGRLVKPAMSFGQAVARAFVLAAERRGQARDELTG